MINTANQIEFRRCQKCGRVEKVAQTEVLAAGGHPDHCDNERENWVHFTADPEWRPVGHRDRAEGEGHEGIDGGKSDTCTMVDPFPVVATSRPISP